MTEKAKKMWVKKIYNYLFGEKENMKDINFEATPPPEKPIVEKIKTMVKPKFTVEHYPLTKRYYPKYGDHFLQEDRQRGTIKKIEPFLFAFADYGWTEEDAIKLIDLYKEQCLKENVRTIEVPD